MDLQALGVNERQRESGVGMVTNGGRYGGGGAGGGGCHWLEYVTARVSGL